jgi:hypothetical protein
LPGGPIHDIGAEKVWDLSRFVGRLRHVVEALLMKLPDLFAMSINPSVLLLVYSLAAPAFAITGEPHGHQLP